MPLVGAGELLLLNEAKSANSSDSWLEAAAAAVIGAGSIFEAATGQQSIPTIVLSCTELHVHVKAKLSF